MDENPDEIKVDSDHLSDSIQCSKEETNDPQEKKKKRKKLPSVPLFGPQGLYQFADKLDLFLLAYVAQHFRKFATNYFLVFPT